MTMLLRRVAWLPLVLALAPLVATSAPAPAMGRPNFVFYLTDDQSYLDLSCTGNTVLQTPAMDQLAAEGVFFEKAFVTTSICCCSRASIYTGQHMRRHGVQDFATPLSAAQLQETFPVLLRRAGYRTGFLGKYAIGSPEVDAHLALPADLFDLWYGFPQNIAYKQTENGQERYLTTVMTEKAVHFIKSAKPEQPFCLIVALKEPHGPATYFDPEFPMPYTEAVIPRPGNLTHESFNRLPDQVRKSLAASTRWIDSPSSYQATMRRRYAYIARADRAIAEIQATLHAQGLDQNTVVIFMSDNGSFEGAHALTDKWLMQEESIHVPLVIKDPRRPARVPERRTQMVLNIDLAPTILGLAGVPVPARMQGMSLEPLLANPGSKTRDDWYYEHLYSDPTRRPIPKVEGVRTERWKYTRYSEAKPALEQLFDLAADPHEEKDLADDPARRELLARLRARCDEYRMTLK